MIKQMIVVFSGSALLIAAGLLTQSVPLMVFALIFAGLAIGFALILETVSEISKKYEGVRVGFDMIR